MSLNIGVRWDDEVQNNRFKVAQDLGLIHYIEVNYPIAKDEKPIASDLPIYAHSAYNGLCSAFGLNKPLVQIIKKEADKYNSPWIGEHLSWIAPSQTGALGYVFNTIYNDDFLDVTVQNINQLQSIYNRPIALELGPQYYLDNSDYNEIDFHIKVAEITGCSLILDLTHLIISNNNLKRPLNYGIDKYKNQNTIEVHIAGIRKSTNGYWHDNHDNLPDSEVLNTLQSFCKDNKTLKAITFEHSASASEESFFKGLNSIHSHVGAVNA